MSANRMLSTQQVLLTAMLQRTVAQVNNQPKEQKPQHIERKSDLKPKKEKAAHVKHQHDIHQPASRKFGHR